jgi:hypothetical protein
MSAQKFEEDKLVLLLVDACKAAAIAAAAAYVASPSFSYPSRSWQRSV